MGRGGACIARRALILTLAWAVTAPAWAQEDAKPKKRPQPTPPAAAPPAPAPTPNPPIRPPPPPTLRSAVRSTSSRPAVIGRSTTAQCRAQCSEQRLSCLAVPESGDCDGKWTQCLSTCAGLDYGRAPVPPDK
jgi:hypothetical protein